MGLFFKAVRQTFSFILAVGHFGASVFLLKTEATQMPRAGKLLTATSTDDSLDSTMQKYYRRREEDQG
jgi:hypothetical protein